MVTMVPGQGEQFQSVSAFPNTWTHRNCEKTNTVSQTETFGIFCYAAVANRHSSPQSMFIILTVLTLVTDINRVHS